MDIKEGDIVTSEKYDGILKVERRDNLLTTLTNEIWWFCTDIKDEEHFDSYKEEDLTKINHL